MRVGEWEIQDGISYAFLIMFICIIVTNAIFVIWLWWRILKELKEPAIDLFKIVQPVLVIIWFSNWIYGYLLYFWYISKNYIFVRVIFVVLLSSLYLYYAINWFTCYLLIYHIKALKQLREGKSYQEWRRKIWRTEKRVVVFLIIFEFLYLLINVFLTILPDFNLLFIKNIGGIVYVQLMIIFIGFSFWQFYLYIQLSYVMKTDLNFYFNHNWKRLSLMMRLNALYFFLFLFWNLSFFLWDLNIYRIIGMYDPYNIYLRIIFLFSYIAGNIAQYMYVYFNYYGINFKDWIFDLLSGYRQIQYYKSSSVFILSNCMYRVRLESFNSITN